MTKSAFITIDKQKELEEANAELVKALREAADHIDDLSFDHNFNNCDIPDKYHAIASKHELKE